MADPQDSFVNGLPDASGTFTGTWDADWDPAVLVPPDALLPVTVTVSEPLSAAVLFITELTVTAGEDSWTFPVARTEVTGPGRVTFWLRRG